MSPARSPTRPISQPLQSAEISIARTNGRRRQQRCHGRIWSFHDSQHRAGAYTVSAHLLGFRPITRPVTVPATGSAAAVTFAMTPIGMNLDAVQVIATVPISLDTRTGDQVFKQNDFHGAPTNTTSQILQQSIAGAVRAPTGEVHIRGQHAEYTYYVDGVPVPPGISGSLNELFDPSVVNQINFQTGGWDAEYGGRNAAVVNVTTKCPPADSTAVSAPMPARSIGRPRPAQRASMASRSAPAETTALGACSFPADVRCPTCGSSRC